jgi:hypothetical protein
MFCLIPTDCFKRLATYAGFGYGSKCVTNCGSMLMFLSYIVKLPKGFSQIVELLTWRTQMNLPSSQEVEIQKVSRTNKPTAETHYR